MLWKACQYDSWNKLFLVQFHLHFFKHQGPSHMIAEIIAGEEVYCLILLRRLPQ